ncbi:hypothetical protein ATANTOWER_010323, partial [Ataeniobius toweri]|nr:hypothetical protein [Ataeniobius toweri]
RDGLLFSLKLRLKRKLFSKKGGVPGTKIRLVLNSLSQQHVECRQETIIRCMMEFLGESAEELIKDYMVNSNSLRFLKLL